MRNKEQHEAKRGEETPILIRNYLLQVDYNGFGHLNRQAETRMVQQCDLDDFSLDYQEPVFPQVPGVTTSICQRGQFATFYDGGLGIPRYAVYMLTDDEVKKFKSFKRPTSDPWSQTPGITHQGSNDLYKGGNYQRGHIVPFETLSYSEESGLASFTYTNCVPQVGSFNTGLWRVYEAKIRKYAGVCTSQGGTLYLITGISFVRLVTNPKTLQLEPELPHSIMAFPNKPGIVQSQKIAIPNSMWTAGCCWSAMKGIVTGAFAVIGNNDENKEMNKRIMAHQSLPYVEQVLQKENKNIELFPGHNDCYDLTKQVTL
ncbi:hypothetical protein AWC38_SpisGene22057 [Stylophora pistillata]|uniref:Nuclease EXOG, mitochondrial n=1 Tax=Stylophora pistillata TaxID=50429 RepID=A0A2B4RC72_STYPI|nr:hypothetical protein AWC38_SpisGene22057 [Stylophora pistillata]